MSDLTISEVKAKISEAERQIFRILDNLQQVTGVAADKVTIYTASLDPVDGRPYKLITHVRMTTGSL